MSKLPRLLQLSLIIILLISVCALAPVAYIQHEGQQYWENKYKNAITQEPVTFAISEFGNSTDFDKAEFMDNLHQKIVPVKIMQHDAWNAVTFWFEKRDVGNGTILLHLPNQSENNYEPIDVPFFDARLCVPPYR